MLAGETPTTAVLFYILCSNTFHKDTWPANEKGKCFIEQTKNTKQRRQQQSMHMEKERKQNKSPATGKALVGFKQMAALVEGE